jgi:hypothetical protein
MRPTLAAHQQTEPATRAALTSQPRLSPQTWARLIFLSAGLASAQAAQAQLEAPGTALENASVSVQYEQFTLPGNETMGMAAIGMAKEFAPNLQLGIASYAAVRGERGGFITLGLTAEKRWPMSPSWALEAGGFVGAGGGRGGYTLSGGGLMLRGHAGLALNLTPLVGLPGRLSLGLSRVSFPNGVIGSTQPYVSYALPFQIFTRSGFSSPESETLSASDAARLSPRSHETGVVFRRYQVASGTLNDSGGPQADFDLLGLEWRTSLGSNLYAKMETEGAMGGGATGYMQILGGLGVRLPLTDRLTARASASVGGGGGGGVDTGGGLLLDTGVSLQFDFTKQWFAEAVLQQIRATSGPFKASSVALLVGYRFGQETRSGDRMVFDPHLLRIRIPNQTYLQASNNWRSHNAEKSVQNLGVQIDVFVQPHLYLTGQGLAAWQGDAGAYMTGQVGAGVNLPITQTVSAEAEWLLGAAGGGGLRMGSGIVTQVNAGLVWQATDALSLHANLGHLRALNGEFRAHTVGLGLGYRFTGFTSR